MDLADLSTRATLKKLTTQQVTRTTRFPSVSHPDAAETTAGDWLVQRSAAPPVGRVSPNIGLMVLAVYFSD